ncbi:hypothetical protein Lal_00037746 [Lupinus albus]|nr:hypothetical protein Lal_00037746 [Lupinus albus]
MLIEERLGEKKRKRRRRRKKQRRRRRRMAATLKDTERHGGFDGGFDGATTVERSDKHSGGFLAQAW